MKPDKNAGAADKVIHRLAELRRQVGESVGAEHRAHEKEYQNLNTAMEELRVANEELVAQNEALIETQNELAEQRERYRELFEYAPDAYLVTDSRGTIRDANRFCESMLHLKRALLCGKAMLLFIDRAQRAEFRDAVASIADGPGIQHFRWRITPRRKLQNFEAELAASLMRNSDGHVESIRWLIRDITRVNETARQLTEYQRRLRALAAEVSKVEERERRRIAVDIHDRISQNLAIAKMKLLTLQSHASPEMRKQLDGEFAGVLALLGQSLEDTRTLTFELSPPVLYELGLSAALHWLAEQLQRQYNIKISVDAGDAADHLSEDVRSLLFRAVRELLTNVIKHADATAARVSLRQAGDFIRLTVADDGKGVDAEAAGDPQRAQGGFGLFSIRTRIEQIGGNFEISSLPDAGSRVTLTAPIKPPHGAADNKTEVAHGDANTAR